MAKKRSKRRSKKPAQNTTNWPLIGGVVFVGVLILGALLALSMRDETIVTLEQFCKENTDSCIATGAQDAPVTIVEIQDFGCPHCRSFHEETAPLIFSNYVATDQVQFIILPFALGANTLPATNAGMCANEEGRYFEFADALFAQFDNANYLSRDSLISAAETSGVEDLEEFATCVDEGRYNRVIDDNINLARSHRISSTPNFMVNNTKLEGAQPFSVFQQRIESFINN